MQQTATPDLPPIASLLTYSIYYPASGFDGSIVKHYASTCSNFVYCDYGVKEDEFLKQIETFSGYDVLTYRPITQAELVPAGWQPTIPAHLLVNYDKYAGMLADKPPFAYWVACQRKSGYDDEHGPLQFNLLFICGEGVATYQALYWSNRLTAKVVAVVRPGTGFGFNWTNFRDGQQALGYVVMKNPHGQPDYLIGELGQPLNWKCYPNSVNDGSFERYTLEKNVAF